MQKRSEVMREQILSSMSASYWLKDAIRGLDKRDVLDALKDAEELVRIYSAAFEECVSGDTVNENTWPAVK